MAVSVKPWIIVGWRTGWGGTGHNARISHIVDTFSRARRETEREKEREGAAVLLQGCARARLELGGTVINFTT